MSAMPSPYLAGSIGQPVTPTQGTQQPIGGALPFGQPNVGGMFSGDLGGSYQSAYNTALGQNQANYSNILSGYQQTLAGQQTAQGAIGQGYNQLYNQVLGGIQGIGQSQAQAISDAYAQQSGQSQQDLINRGLGNSTILSSVQRGTQLDQQKANIALSNQVAQLNAGYQSSLGMAGLNYANQAAMQNSAQQNQQLQFQNSVTAQYPNAQAYSQLYQQQGAIGQSNADRAQAADQFNRQMQAAQAARAAGQVGGLGSMTRQGGGGLGPGVWGPGSASAGGLSSVTPFGLGGPSGGAGGYGIQGAGYGNPTPGIQGSGVLGGLYGAGMATPQYPGAPQAPGDTQWQQGAYGLQGGGAQATGLMGGAMSLAGANDYEDAGAY